MDSNKEAAEECLKRAKSCIAAGDKEKAIRMVEKSLRLYETEHGKFLLDKAKNMSNEPPPSESTTRQRRPTTSTPQEPVQKNFTPEQAAQVNKVLSARKDYYKVLGVEKSASDGDIKKAYRKLALKMHPDKNQAPRADEAFKVISAAYKTLSDENERAAFDRYGADGATQSRGGGHRGQHFHFDEDHINPDEIFNMFFGGGFPSQRMRRTHHFRHNFNHQQQRRHQQQQQYEQEYTGSAGVWLQFMPLLVLIALSLFSNMMTPDPTFSLHKSVNRGYVIKHAIPNENPPVYYWTKSDYVSSYPKGSKVRKDVEKQVRHDFVENLRMNCYQETLNAEQKLRRAQIYRDQNLIKQAQNMPRPSCDRLHQMVGA